MPVDLYVKTQQGKTVKLSVPKLNGVTILSLKYLIQDAAKVDVNMQVLKYRGKELSDDNATLVECEIDREAIIRLSTCAPPASKSKSTTTTTTTCKGKKGKQEKQEAIPVIATARKDEFLSNFSADADDVVEVCFAFDTTGSMYGVIEQVRTQVSATVSRLLKEIANIRISIMAIGDYCDDSGTYAVKTLDFTSDKDKLVKFVKNVSRTGGGDAPECYELGLRKAQSLDWSENSAKAYVLIADDTPHHINYTTERIDWQEELDVLSKMNIKIYGVQASSHNATTGLFYNEMAKRTGGLFLKFTEFSLITDMFLAVCYREVSPEKLEQYREEVEESGRLEGNLEDLMAQLEAPNMEKVETVEPEERAKEYPHIQWWCAANAPKGNPSYSLENGKWVNYRPSSSSSSSSTVTTSTSYRFTGKKTPITSSSSSSSSTTSTTSTGSPGVVRRRSSVFNIFRGWRS